MVPNAIGVVAFDKLHRILGVHIVPAGKEFKDKTNKIVSKMRSFMD